MQQHLRWRLLVHSARYNLQVTHLLSQLCTLQVLAFLLILCFTKLCTAQQKSGEQQPSTKLPLADRQFQNAQALRSANAASAGLLAAHKDGNLAFQQCF